MAIRDILLLVDGGRGSTARIDATLALADAWDAHLVALALVPEPYIPAAVGVNIPPEILEQQRRRAEEEADALLSRVDERAGRFARPVERRREIAPIDRLPVLFARHGRHADLVVVGQPDPEENTADQALLVESAFMHSGRPALVVPYIGARAMPPETVICCWDGSREAARAINDAIPFLEKAKRVLVTVVDPQSLGGRVGPIAGADMAAHLAHHGIAVEVKDIESGGLDVADVILSHAADEGADMLVMGGYGHSRLREIIFGGTTQYVLEHMTVPVLFAH
ncbi:hypothetical protein HRbin40_01320 [bacterium HR40]|nr:hypothetical protein HRbin40_01320 [bacterium HR40]